MPSIWSQMDSQDQDAVLAALEQASLETSGPGRPSQPLPLPEVDWALTVQPGELSDGEAWPPPSFGARQERLELYHDLWRGDLSRLIDTRVLTATSVGPINLFRRIPRFVGDLLVRELPTAGQAMGAASDVQLVRLLHSAATQVVKAGLGGILFMATSEGPIIRAIDSRWLYRMPDGGYLIAEPRIKGVQPGTTIPNALSVLVVEPDTNVTAMTISGTPTGAGAQVSVGPVTAMGRLGNGILIPTLALPEQGDNAWGTSWYDDLITIVIQKARRRAADTRVLDDNSDPLLLMKGDLDSYTVVPGIPRSSAASPIAPDEVERDARVQKRLRRVGGMVVPAGVDAAEYVTWDGSLEWSAAIHDQIDRDFRLLSGLPNVLEAEMGEASGVSLRRQFWQFDASFAPIYHGLHSAMTMGLNALGLPFEWQNAFDVIQDAPGANAREDVENEATARRGEGEGNASQA